MKWKDRMLEIPASHWGGMSKEFWKKEGFEESLRKLSLSVVSKKVVLCGKVIETHRT